MNEQTHRQSVGLTSITLPLEEYQSMLDEMKKLKEANSKLCRGANIIKVLKVDSLFAHDDLAYFGRMPLVKVSLTEEFSDDVVEKFQDEVGSLIERNYYLEEELTEKNNKINELSNKGSLNLLTFVVGCFVGALVMYFQ